MSIRNRPRAHHDRLPSISSRSFHHEPYPPTPSSSQQQQSDGLLPTPSTSSPTRQTHPLSSLTNPLADTSQTRAQIQHRLGTLGPLLLYFSLNLLLTLYNKIVLVRFPFPYTLTALHALAGTLGAFLLVHKPSLAWRTKSPLTGSAGAWGALAVPAALARYTWRFRLGRIFSIFQSRPPVSAPPGSASAGYRPLSQSSRDDEGSLTSLDALRADHASDHGIAFASADPSTRVLAQPTPAVKSNLDLTPKETLVIVAFSFLYTINIVVSNVSLGLVTVPFHQVVRSSTPFFTIGLSLAIFGQRASRAKLGSLIPVIAGVAFATYGDYYFTLWGFTLTLLGTLLAALKTIVTHYLQAPPLKKVTPPLPRSTLTSMDAVGVPVETFSPYGADAGARSSKYSPYTPFIGINAIDTHGSARKTRVSGIDSPTIGPSLSRSDHSRKDQHGEFGLGEHNLTISDLLEAQREDPIASHNSSPSLAPQAGVSLDYPSLSPSASMPNSISAESFRSSESLSSITGQHTDNNIQPRKPHPLSMAMAISLSKSRSRSSQGTRDDLGKDDEMPPNASEYSEKNCGSYSRPQPLPANRTKMSPRRMASSRSMENDHMSGDDLKVDMSLSMDAAFTSSADDKYMMRSTRAPPRITRAHSDSGAFSTLRRADKKAKQSRSRPLDAQGNRIESDTSSSDQESATTGPPPPYSVVDFVSTSPDVQSIGVADTIGEGSRSSEDSIVSNDSQHNAVPNGWSSHESADAQDVYSDGTHGNAPTHAQGSANYAPSQNPKRWHGRNASYASFETSYTSTASLDDFFAARPHAQTPNKPDASFLPCEQVPHFDSHRYTPTRAVYPDGVHQGNGYVGDKGSALGSRGSASHLAAVPSAPGSAGHLNEVQQRGGLLRPLSPLDLLLLTSPLAFIQCVLIAHFTGELERV
ncbi:hypothetical protein HGRIS_012352 [Hohenbuehelia grisea]